ncbi:MAG: pilus motility taxis protein HmpF [Microcoleus vaginatus WJT46-NPBG5]|nr:pilus motility taxis protein HmpF [Microcoleus vaginatus WJT46-NPBG5]
MLYLAEVQIQKALMGSKAQLKLLACQRGEQSWNAVPGEDVIPFDDVSKFNAGALVLVELNANKQMQRPPQEASRQLVSILQNFSRLQDKFKTQEEEIEQWKQSLTYQSQELNRREMELQAREEEIGQMQGEFERLEAQRQEISGAREEASRLQEELERNRQELESSWQHLRGEMQRVQEQATSGKAIDDEQARTLQELLDRLSGTIAPTDSVRQQLNLAFERATAQQSVLDYHRQQLEQQRGSAEHLQGEVDRIAQDWQTRTQDWQQAHASLDMVRAELKVQQNTLKLKQEYGEALALKLQIQDELHQQVYQLADTSDKVSISSEKVDVEALERMPVEELQGLFQQLQQDLEKVFRFVNDQEEELGMQRQALEEVQAKLNTASEYERMSLQEELADEQDRYQMLNETLVGQRRNLREREEILAQHQAVLWRRLGKSANQGSDNKLELGPILASVEIQRQQMGEELQKLEREIEQMRLSIQQAEGMIHQQAGEQEAKHHELKQLEEHLQEQRAALAELWGKVNVYQEMLQPLQDRLNELRQNLEEAAGVLNQVQETGDHQLQAIAQMRQVFMSLMSDSSPQFAVS